METKQKQFLSYQYYIQGLRIIVYISIQLYFQPIGILSVKPYYALHKQHLYTHKHTKVLK